MCYIVLPRAGKQRLNEIKGIFNIFITKKENNICNPGIKFVLHSITQGRKAKIEWNKGYFQYIYNKKRK